MRKADVSKLVETPQVLVANEMLKNGYQLLDFFHQQVDRNRTCVLYVLGKVKKD